MDCISFSYILINLQDYRFGQLHNYRVCIGRKARMCFAFNNDIIIMCKHHMDERALVWLGLAIGSADKSFLSEARLPSPSVAFYYSSNEMPLYLNKSKNWQAVGLISWIIVLYKYLLLGIHRIGGKKNINIRIISIIDESDDIIFIIPNNLRYVYLSEKQKKKKKIQHTPHAVYM